MHYISSSAHYITVILTGGWMDGQMAAWAFVWMAELHICKVGLPCFFFVSQRHNNFSSLQPDFLSTAGTTPCSTHIKKHSALSRAHLPPPPPPPNCVVTLCSRLYLESWPSWYAAWNRLYQFAVSNQKEQWEDYLSVIVLCNNNEAGY